VARPVVIVSDLLPPKRGGLADHTKRLATELAAFGPVFVLTSPGAGSSDKFFVRPSIGNWGDLDWIMAELGEFPDDSVLLWQYVPHMYGRGGVNRALPRFWRDLRRIGQRQVFLAHEIMADLMMIDVLRRPAHFWYAMNHRRQWKALLSAGDAVAISTGRWVEDWAARRPDVAKKMFLLPSPTSIEPVAVNPDHGAMWRAQHRLPVKTKIIAYFGTLSAAKQLPWVIDAWRTAHTETDPVALALIGGAPPLRLPADLQNLYRPLGYLPEPEVSAALHAADLLALPFLDGISERRTTLMAGLAHGLAVVTTNGHNTGSALRRADFLSLNQASDEGEFIRSVVDLLRDNPKRARLAAAGKAACARDYSWPVIVSRLRSALEPAGSQAPGQSL
jgi:glycosyltransferase involved in cell wall biosynthesis